MLGAKRQRLKENQLTVSTLDSQDYDLVTTSNWQLKITDIPGGISRDFKDDDVKAKLDSADAVLFFVEWLALDLSSQIGAIDRALNRCAQLPCGLVFTKSEAGLEKDDPAWDSPTTCWRDNDNLRESGGVVEKFGEAVWLTSSFGYNAVYGPAFVLGEFGQLLPFNPRPINVCAPFKWALSRIGIQ